MNDLIFHSLVYLVAFLAVWLGSGLVVKSVVSLARSWKLPIFTVSFFILGILTSLPEISIGIMAIIEDKPLIFAGNLLGGVIVMFLGIIPLLGMLGNGIKIPTQLSLKQILVSLVIILAPSLLTADQKIESWEGVLMVLLYLILFLFFSKDLSLAERIKNTTRRKSLNKLKLLGKIITGIILMAFASQQIVNSTLFFADKLNISPFFVSLIVVSIGTNIPEITIVFRSILQKQKDVALADYLGSASANTLLFGFFSLLYWRPIYLPNHFLIRLTFLILALTLFFIFARSKRILSRKESVILFLLYIAFILFEIYVIS